jgi:hypothetical protein
MHREALTRYLEATLSGSVEIVSVRPLGPEAAAAGATTPGVTRDLDLKRFGYGRPIQIDLLLDGVPRSYVLSTMRGGSGFGHDHFADRAAAQIWAHDAYGKLPRHVKSLDVGFITRDGALRSAGQAEEFFILMDKVPGTPYRIDLERIRTDGALLDLDLDRAGALSSYLADIHAEKADNPQLYFRRIRDLIGHGEGIMGILDGYPPDYPLLPSRRQYLIEAGCIAWRQWLKQHPKRLSVVHGDFHPWNILFRDGTDFTLLDRSRGEWGEPADDVASLSINYLFYSLIGHGRAEGPFAHLFECFYGTYLDRSQDPDLNQVIPLFYIFRALVIASPVWYPDLPDEVRCKLFNFVHAMLEIDSFEPGDLNRYVG